MIRNIFLIISALISITLAQDISSQILSSEIISIKKPTSESLKVIRTIYDSMELYKSDFIGKIEKHYEANGNIVGFKYNSEKQFKHIEKYILGNFSKIVKQYAAMQIPTLIMNGFHHKNIDIDTKKTVLNLLHPNDIMWSLDTGALLFFSNWNSNIAIRDYSFSLQGICDRVMDNSKDKQILLNKVKEYYLPIYRSNPSRAVKAVALSNYIDRLYLAQKGNEAKRYFKILKNEFPDIEEIQITLENFDPNSPTNIGNKVPYFSNEDCKSQLLLTPETFKGKYYLIQFWSITCPPCIAEMEEIHELYKKYKDNNFTILSFAMGDSKDRLNEFWDKKWQMPWFNASLINGWKDKTAKEFIVLGIPFLLLVNPDGNVVENNLSFRYKNIDEVISKYLK